MNASRSPCPVSSQSKHQGQLPAPRHRAAAEVGCSGDGRGPPAHTGGRRDPSRGVIDQESAVVAVARRRGRRFAELSFLFEAPCELRPFLRRADARTRRACRLVSPPAARRAPGLARRRRPRSTTVPVRAAAD